MKLVMLRKKLLKEAGIYVGALAIVAGVLFFVDSKQTSQNEEMNTLNTKVSSVNSEIQNLQTQFTKAKNSLKLFESIEKGKQGVGDSLSRDNAKKLLDKLKEEYLLGSLSMTVSPTVELKESSISTKTAQLVTSDVVLKFEGMSDEQLFSFVNAISKEFSGYIKFTKLELTRTGEISTDVLKAVSRGEKPTLVNGELAFKWYGLKGINKSDADTDATAAAAGAPAAPADGPGG